MDKISKRTQQILKALKIIAWIAYIGFSIETGAILIVFVISWFHPDAARRFYGGEDIYALRQFSFAHYIVKVSLMAMLPVLKATVCRFMIRVLSMIKIVHPFISEVTRLLVRSSYLLLLVWIITAFLFIHQQWLLKLMGRPQVGELSGESLLTAGLVFVIAQIFKRGVEIQSENELTV